MRADADDPARVRDPAIELLLGHTAILTDEWAQPIRRSVRRRLMQKGGVPENDVLMWRSNPQRRVEAHPEAPSVAPAGPSGTRFGDSGIWCPPPALGDAANGSVRRDAGSDSFVKADVDSNGGSAIYGASRRIRRIASSSGCPHPMQNGWPAGSA